jgi:hypothetical protein
MATYEEYLEHAKSKKFQPVKEDTFNSLSKAGFDPIKNTFEKAGKLNLAPLPEGMPKLTEAVAKIETERTERAARKAEKASGGGGAMPKSNRDITKNYKKGGSVSSASKRADGIAVKGKTRGRMI